MNQESQIPCWRCQRTLPEVTFATTAVDNIRRQLCNRCYGNMSGNISLHNKTARKWGVEGHLTRQDWIQTLHNSADYCYYCKQFIGYYHLVLEHIIPMVNGGKNLPENIVAACTKCNSKKARSSVEEWQQRTENEQLLELLQQHLGISTNSILNQALKLLAAQVENIGHEVGGNEKR
jgi:HNH endonuclease